MYRDHRRGRVWGEGETEQCPCQLGGGLWAVFALRPDAAWRARRAWKLPRMEVMASCSHVPGLKGCGEEVWAR